jgi:hypothetical protein
MLSTIMTHMRHRVRGTLAACAIVVLVAASAVATAAVAAAAVAAPAGHGLKEVHDPGRVTGTIRGRCYYRDRGQLPDPRCTPGSIDPIVTQANISSTICKGGWTDPHLRPPYAQTHWFKFHVAYPAYGLGWARSELDHLVPLELGGSNDATNLWPEVGAPSGNPKDHVENALNAAVCDGRVSLAAAQQAIASDWMTAEKRLGIGPVVTGSGGGGGGGGGGGKAWCTASASPANDGYSGDYTVHITSDEPDQEATASDAGDTWHEYTGSSGAATITLWHTSAGETIKVTVGSASCSTTA